MSTIEKSLLIATDEATKYWGLLPAPPGFSTEHAHGWIEAVDAVMHKAYDVIMVTYPFADNPFNLFIHAVRSRSSMSRGAGLVVLTTPDQKAEALIFIGKGVNRVISTDESVCLHEAINNVVNVSPRGPARLMVHLQMPFGERKCAIRTFTENISSTGMLLGTTNQLEIGRQFDFEFSVPDSEETVTGRAEVVRHSFEQGGNVNGIGIRFISLESESSEALKSYLGQILPVDDYSEEE